MGIIGKDFKYKLIKNFISKDEATLLTKYCEIKHRTNNSNFDTSQSDIFDTYFYGDPVIESLLLIKKPLMEKLTGCELLPTYSFWRMYTKYAELKNHTDRPSCEISATVNIGSDGTDWPIFMGNEPIHTLPGDAAVYLGAEIEHRRDPFDGDWCAQAFLHYVKKDGIYKDHFMDKRNYWGTQKR